MMTEADWRAATDPHLLLDYLFPVRNLDSVEDQGRRSRLYLVACARAAWDRLPAVGRAVVGVSEWRLDWDDRCPAAVRHAAGAAAEALHNSCREPEEVPRIARELADTGVPVAAGGPTPDPVTWPGLAYLVYAAYARAPAYRVIPAALHSVDFIRDIFGNPFRPVAVDPNWLTSTVVALAHGIYDDRAFDRMPHLADALQDAGCDHPDILAHCRGPGPHVRGCWVLERILGKS